MFATATLILASCDLDKYPEGQYVSDGQKEETIKDRPNLITAEVNAMAAKLNAFGTISDDASTSHNDYGVPAVSMALESGGQDLVALVTGYNWFNTSQNYSDRVYDSSMDELIWKTFYNHLKAANNVLSLIDPATEDASLKTYRGQALAARAYDYLNLVQIYQFTYAGHENALAVPIVTEKMSDEEMQNNPRATVQQVYDQIMSDLNQAAELLAGFDNGANKDQLDEAVVYGLRARANLLMQKWADAAKDAERAIAGGTPQSLAEVSTPTFNSATANSWLWGVMITPDNDVVQTGIINWPSHLCSFTGNGYTSGVPDGYRKVNTALYDQIPDTDIRKQWFLSPDNTSSLIDNEKIEGYSIVEYFGLEPYVNTKFGAYQSVFGNTTNASDWPLMRVEEMYLIKAEGEAMSGNVTGAKATLESFLCDYRDPEYSCTASTPETLQEEIYHQRRIELWGEGMNWFDVMRLNKGVDRRGAGYPNASSVFNIQPGDPILLWRLPEKEIQANPALSNSDNNEAVPVPSPVPDIE